MTATSFCDRKADRGFLLVALPDDQLIPLAIDVDRLFQAIPAEQEAYVCHALYCLQDVYREIGRRAVAAHVAGKGVRG